MSNITRAIESLNDFCVYLELEGIKPNLIIHMETEALERLCFKINGEYRMIGSDLSPVNPLTINTPMGPVRFTTIDPQA